MPVRTIIHGSENALFITFTCIQWLQLIELTNHTQYFPPRPQLAHKAMSESRLKKRLKPYLIDITTTK